ncbi:patatin-like phospholipase family protein [Aliikangiella sp. G2MR2-5]|uniref:patatin-like phospholipase family protein n=1 Tax=Aliikangiella sp. G2MR2-5 TaxID=2788943 RepID=UPI0018A8F915|nr:patatin-like phospholipase family protein [Aliikangiella sp. G2MR2-5]
MRILLVFSCLLFSNYLLAERPKIGLALSGGGARGAAHIGVLRELERLNIPVDYIAGTSMGAIIGALYASGYTPDEIEQIVITMDWQAAFDDEVARNQRSYRRKLDNRRFVSNIQLGLDSDGIKLPAGIVSGQSIGLMLNRYFAPVSHIRDFNQLKIPFHAVATDLATGEEVVLQQGSLAEAVTASMSIPGFLIPVEKQQQLLVDGGIANNLPVSVVRNMGADVVIAVDISTPLIKRKDIKDVVDVADQLTGLLTRKNTELQITSLEDSDVLIVPELGEISTTDFPLASQAIPKGLKAAQQNQKLKRLAEKFSGLEVTSQVVTNVKDLSRVEIDHQRVVEVIIDNQTSISTERIRNKIHTKANSKFSFKKLEKDIGAIYGMGYFNLVQYSLQPQATGIVVTYHVTEKSWGPNYLRLGFNFSASENIDNQFNVSANYLMTNINKLNGELSLGLKLGNDREIGAEWYQPLDSRWSPFINTQVAYLSNQFNFFRENELVAELNGDSIVSDLAVGFEFDNWGEVRLGAHYIDGKVKHKVGEAIIDELSYKDASEYIKLEIDTLDSLYFPRDGFLLQSSYSRSSNTLSSEFEYQQNQTRMIKAFEWNENSVTLGLSYLRSKGQSIPLNAFHRSGGLLNFSGYEINQISSENVASVFAVYMRKIKPVDFLDMYLGFSYEQGQVWNEPEEFDWDNHIDGYSIFFGIDTKLGPFYIGYGKNEESKSLYIMLDKLF